MLNKIIEKLEELNNKGKLNILGEFFIIFLKENPKSKTAKTLIDNFLSGKELDITDLTGWYGNNSYLSFINESDIEMFCDRFKI